MNEKRRRNSSMIWWLWTTIYLAGVAAMTIGLVQARQWATTQLATPAARQDWQQWKQESESHENGQKPVARRPIEHDSPTTLLMLRDHWAICWLGLLLTGSFLFWTTAFLFTGAIGLRRHRLEA